MIILVLGFDIYNLYIYNKLEQIDAAYLDLD